MYLQGVATRILADFNGGTPESMDERLAGSQSEIVSLLVHLEHELGITMSGAVYDYKTVGDVLNEVRRIEENG